MEDEKDTKGGNLPTKVDEGTLEFIVRVSESDIWARIVYPQQILDETWEPTPELERGARILERKVMEGLAEACGADVVGFRDFNNNPIVGDGKD